MICPSLSSVTSMKEAVAGTLEGGKGDLKIFCNCHFKNEA
jgi:hypothetical protein